VVDSRWGKIGCWGLEAGKKQKTVGRWQSAVGSGGKARKQFKITPVLSPVLLEVES
jgi:hypothetical protein